MIFDMIYNILYQIYFTGGKYMKNIDELLVGALDLHEHLGPSIIPRELDVVEAVLEAKAAGIRAIVAKDHQFPTVAHAELAKKYFGQDSDIKVFSAIALNHEVGGLNTAALQTAINMGIKYVWMPTVSTENHHVKHAKGGLKFPSTKSLKPGAPEIKKNYIKIINEDGTVVEEMYNVLELIARHDHLVMGTGHGTSEEADAIIKTASKLGVKNIIATHPAYMIDASLEQMKNWISLGAYIEICACTSDPISNFYHFNIDDTADLIKKLGSENMIIASDYGQKGNVRPMEGLKHFLGLLLERGISEEEIRTMIAVNTAKIVGM